MAAAIEEGEKIEKPEAAGLGEGVGDFIQRHRKTLGALAAVVLVVMAGFIAGFAIRDALRERAIKTVEELNLRYGSLKGELDNEALAVDVEALLGDLANFADKNSGYAAARAYSIIAEIHAGKNDWAAALESWKTAAKAGAKTYLAPAALFNAATAAEEGGDQAAALELYAQSLAYADSFPAAPRAQFSIGRLHEAAGDGAAARASYNELLNKWPDDPIWASLAQSRIIVLDIENP